VDLVTSQVDLAYPIKKEGMSSALARGYIADSGLYDREDS
jgi:hypothetical protein